MRVKIEAVMTSNYGAALSEAMRRAWAFCVIPSFLAYRDLAAGQIEPVLLDWSLPEYRVFAAYPHRRVLSPTVTVFIEARS